MREDMKVRTLVAEDVARIPIGAVVQKCGKSYQVVDNDFGRLIVMTTEEIRKDSVEGWKIEDQ